MRRHDSQSSTEHPDVVESAPSSPSLSRRSTGHDPEAHLERRDSKLGHLVDSIRNVISQEQTKLFGDAKSSQHHRKYQSTVAERLEKLREQDRSQRERVEEEMLSDPEVEESLSPAVEARSRSDLNENNMGPSSHELPQCDSWSSYPVSSKGPSTTGRKSSFKKTKEEVARMTPQDGGSN
ncbi:hypothetical protein A1O3_09661 [Capronia epimyces CBS 606.96]|uniref:Uncharacterized protein n=1 Tax=Capronia epimyces CBS 606.96 TaxID=1182542 RepID=W9XJC5_9EURO|nr:uncharacterized protein A1O3_09661 [Capronia epimyces CBS 606.96]EXJ77435.1 hypothetical protein A1O3_09661 [Capronia epimyces CBS 606.96]